MGKKPPAPCRGSRWGPPPPAWLWPSRPRCARPPPPPPRRTPPAQARRQDCKLASYCKIVGTRSSSSSSPRLVAHHLRRIARLPPTISSQRMQQHHHLAQAPPAGRPHLHSSKGAPEGARHAAGHYTSPGITQSRAPPPHLAWPACRCRHTPPTAAQRPAGRERKREESKRVRSWRAEKEVRRQQGWRAPGGAGGCGPLRPAQLPWGRRGAPRRAERAVPCWARCGGRTCGSSPSPYSG